MKPTRFVFVAVLFIFLSATIYAQPAVKTPSNSWKKLAFDFPVITEQTTVDISRIENGTLISGSLLRPWQDSARYKPKNDIPIPRIYFSTNFFRVVSDNNISEAVDKDNVRKNRSFDLTAESSFQKGFFGALVGFNGSIRKEEIPEVNYGKVVADFERKSYGQRGWVGVRFWEGFGERFIVVKVGRGVVSTKSDFGAVSGFQNYNHDYNRKFVAIEGHMTDRQYRWLAYNVELENNWYNKVPIIRDETNFGKNEFQHRTLKHTLEFVVLPWLEGIRAFIEANQNWGDDEHLLFMNNPPRIQIYLRITFTGQ